MELILLSLHCNHDSSIIKLHQKKSSYRYEEWLFIGRLRVGRVQEMINKEVLANNI